MEILQGGKRCFSDNLIVFRIKSKKSAKVKSWLGWEKLVYESEYCITKFHKFSLDGPLDGVSRSSPPVKIPVFFPWNNNHSRERKLSRLSSLAIPTPRAFSIIESGDS